MVHLDAKKTRLLESIAQMSIVVKPALPGQRRLTRAFERFLSHGRFREGFPVFPELIV
jgi:hypothetical protein